MTVIASAHHYVCSTFDQGDTARAFIDSFDAYGPTDGQIRAMAEYYDQWSHADDGAHYPYVPSNRGEDYAILANGSHVVWHTGLGYVALYRPVSAS